MTIDCLTSRAFLKPRSAALVGRFIVAVMVVGLPMAAHGQAALTRSDIVRAEDARGRGPEGIGPLLAGLRSEPLRPLAIRGIGRLERPSLIGEIAPFFRTPSLRAITAEAIAQATQGLTAEPIAIRRLLVDSVFRLLSDASRRDTDAETRGAIARSIGRLPYDVPEQARAAESALRTLAPLDVQRRDGYPAIEGVAHGLYTLARARRTLGPLSQESVDWLRGAASFGLNVREAAPVRRAAWLALTATGGVDRRDIAATISEDQDPQVRRLAVAALPNVQDSTFRREQLARVARDKDTMVRLEWVRVFRLLAAAQGCGPLLLAVEDPVPHVQLAAIDALGGPCQERDTVIATLRRIIERGPASATRHPTTGVFWHARAHALAALARADTTRSEFLRRDSKHPVWQVRMYVARGAATIRDSTILTALAFDSIGSVREVAIQGLSATVGHLADLVYVRALNSPDYHVALAASRALKGAPVRDSVLPAVLDALDRITREQRQTSRDPRMELLARVREMGNAQSASRLRSLLTDVDPGVATEAAAVMNHLTASRQFVADPSRPAISTDVPNGTVRVQVQMSGAGGRGSFDVALDADRAPMTVARIRELIGKKYYDGLTFHRVVPNFVLQGGSPGMNEYVGDGPFMRDELSLAHHDRYTLGISTRGRDTGDAQWFINLVDNYRLDHEYTVVGRVIRGFDVVDRILEGDVMESVRIVP